MFTPPRQISAPYCNTAHFFQIQSHMFLQVAAHCSPALKKPIFPEPAVKNNAFTRTFLL
ncbi:hypothetical protein B4092_2213 [Bacillus licheniformis]|jgi:hypothetical protein|nr:hypothetical protein LI17339_03425 [Bacillus licheniformis LMG 17339]KYC68463.1 hypothetical protein B4092_2213 [Bacillus licheniformis]KYC83745.1 hypothetical protein B4091_2323 [Bacillus licheniformis]KYD01406.1 hypothetical protein B4164_2089 [Bacillus licheniformis]OLF86504.1 hypothetical protein B4089_3862 [Bacillus licheniformis]